MRIITYIIIGLLLVLTLFFAFQSVRLGLFTTREPVSISKHNIVLEKVENLGNLEVIRYKFKDVLEHTVEYDWWPDSRAILIIAGEATACINLKLVKPEDIVEKGDTIYMRMPKAELCNYKINHEESKIYNTKSYSFDESKVLDEAFKVAEKQIKKTALESNILEQAQQNAEQLLKPLFKELSQKEIIFTYKVESEDKEFKKK
jgi:hypothetical protein